MARHAEKFIVVGGNKYTLCERKTSCYGCGKEMQNEQFQTEYRRGRHYLIDTYINGNKTNSKRICSLCYYGIGVKLRDIREKNGITKPRKKGGVR